jgi:membrane-associated HD superfamily phosphohydrolase
LNWYDSVFELIDMRSFSNLWYWIALAVIWSTSSHWVLGVPYDMVTRAKRMGGEAEADLQTMARINVSRLLWIAGVSGLWLMGIVFFLLTVLASLGFYYHVEFAQAVFLILAPMTIVGALSLRTAGKVNASGCTVPALYQQMLRHRLITQGIGMVSIFITSMWGMWQNMQLGALGQ